MTQRNVRHRTIVMESARAHEVAICSAFLGISGEKFIAAAIASAIATLSSHDPTVALMLARTQSVDWSELERLTSRDADDTLAA